ncbi:hypothetical protein [Homoserinibacter gongjuensis]|uniref:hypothetical protein n=1 Tax=Homoserinibacter gongjuensis TaxID=1162968 RepID=UPI0024E1599E|nr:hypothetical protein [Homoserinibacter gongjuensis]
MCALYQHIDPARPIAADAHVPERRGGVVRVHLGSGHTLRRAQHEFTVLSVALDRIPLRRQRELAGSHTMKLTRADQLRQLAIGEALVERFRPSDSSQVDVVHRCSVCRAERLVGRGAPIREQFAMHGSVQGRMRSRGRCGRIRCLHGA